MPHIRGWVGGRKVGRVVGLTMLATKLCAQWARQMATAALTIPQGEQMSSGTVWDHWLSY